MKLFILLSFSLLILSCDPPAETNCSECDLEDSLANVTEPVDPNGYDSSYAQKLGADQYGMKTYVMAFLKAGPNDDLDSAEQVELQMGHMANINRLADEGKLVLAGPFYSDPESDLQGIYIFNVETLEEAEALTKTDPAIQAGTLVMDLQMWYGSAALMEVNAIHKRIAKENP